MWFKKEQKHVCGNNSFGGNKGVLPERGKGPAPAPKPQPKTYVDVNGKEYDMDKHNFVKDWEIRRAVRRLENYNEKKVAFGDELRGISKENQKEKNDNFNKMMDKAREDVERIFDMLKVEMVKRAKEGNFSCTLDIDEMNEIVKRNGIHINKSPYLEMFFKEICERNNMELETVNQYDGGKIFSFTWK